MKNKKLYCENCNKEQTCIYKEQIKKENIKENKIKYLEKKYICSECGNIVFDKECFDYNITAANDEI